MGDRVRPMTEGLLSLLPQVSHLFNRAALPPEGRSPGRTPGRCASDRARCLGTGQQTLNLLVEVRILYPQPDKYEEKTSSLIGWRSFCTKGQAAIIFICGMIRRTLTIKLFSQFPKNAILVKFSYIGRSKMGF